jgi:hypothetical protein
MDLGFPDPTFVSRSHPRTCASRYGRQRLHRGFVRDPPYPSIYRSRLSPVRATPDAVLTVDALSASRQPDGLGKRQIFHTLCRGLGISHSRLTGSLSVNALDIRAFRMPTTSEG